MEIIMKKQTKKKQTKKKQTKKKKNNFNLENLEKRILLSADFLPFAGLSGAAGLFQTPGNSAFDTPALDTQLLDSRAMDSLAMDSRSTDSLNNRTAMTAEYDRQGEFFDSSFSQIALAGMNGSAKVTSLSSVNALTEISVSSGLRQKTDILRDKLKNIGLSFDFNNLSIPVLSSDLDSIFGISDHIETFKESLLPKIEAADNMTDLVTQLQGKGFEVLGVKDGLSALNIAATGDNSFIHLRFSGSLAQKLSLKAEYREETFNNESHSLLKDLADSVNLESGSDFLSSLKAGISIDFELKLDDSGLMVLKGSSLKADITVSGAVSGSAGRTNQDTFSVSGTAEADIKALLLVKTDGPGIYVQNIASDPAGSFGAAVSGSALINANFEYPGFFIEFGAEYAVSADLSNISTAVNADLDLKGHVKVPGLTDPAFPENSGKIDFTGTYSLDLNQWNLTAAANDLSFMKMDFKDISGSLKIKNSSVSGSIKGDIYLDFLSSSSNTVKSSVNLVFSDAGFTLTGHTVMDSITVKEPKAEAEKIFFQAGKTDIDFNISGLFKTSANESVIGGTITFISDSAQFLPGKASFTASLTDDNTSDSIPAVKGVMDISDRNISFNCRHLKIISENKFIVTADDISLHLDLDSAGQQSLAEIDTADIRLSGFSNNPEFKIDKLLTGSV
jgi:hypothetical protein